MTGEADGSGEKLECPGRSGVNRRLPVCIRRMSPSTRSPLTPHILAPPAWQVLEASRQELVSARSAAQELEKKNATLIKQATASLSREGDLKQQLNVSKQQVRGGADGGRVGGRDGSAVKKGRRQKEAWVAKKPGGNTRKAPVLLATSPATSCPGCPSVACTLTDSAWPLTLLRPPPLRVQVSRLDEDLKSAKAGLAAASQQADAANVQLSAAEAQLRQAESQKASLMRDAQLALSKSSDLKQALNVFKEKVRVRLVATRRRAPDSAHRSPRCLAG